MTELPYTNTAVPHIAAAHCGVAGIRALALNFEDRYSFFAEICQLLPIAEVGIPGRGSANIPFVGCKVEFIIYSNCSLV